MPLESRLLAPYHGLMLAPWIPDALKRVEELGKLPNPPTDLATTGARQALVNVSADFPVPTIEAWETREGTGIVVEWESASIAILPWGGTIESGCV